jgi:hypothetical protein
LVRLPSQEQIPPAPTFGDNQEARHLAGFFTQLAAWEGSSLVRPVIANQASFDHCARMDESGTEAAAVGVRRKRE